MAGGGALPEPGLLDVPTYTIAVVLAAFLLASMAFEKSTHWLIHFLRKRKRNGLSQAVSNLTAELTLVGFIALLLTVLQGPISKICVPYQPESIDLWTLISNVNGCDCCLSDTATVGACFKVDRQCGPEYCNCDAQDPSCVVPPSTLTDLLTEWRADPVCGVGNSSDAGVLACSADYLARAAESPEAETAASLLKLECDGMVQRDTGACGPGRVPLISVTAQHQIHIFIFSVAMMHVVLGVVCVLLASWRIRSWRRMCSDDDEHVQRVRTILNSSPAPSQRWRSTVFSRWGALGMRLHRSATAPPVTLAADVTAAGVGNGSATNGKAIEMQGQQQQAQPEEGAAEAQQAQQGSEQQEQQLQPSARFIDVVRAAASFKAAGSAASLRAKAEENGGSGAADGQADGGSDAGKWASTHGSSLQLNAAAAAGADGRSIDGSAVAEAAAAAAAAAAEAGEAGGELALPSKPLPAVPSSGALSNEGSQQPEGQAGSPPRQIVFGALPEAATTAAPQSAKPAPRAQKSKLIRRTSTLKRGDHVGWLQEHAICLAYCFWPRPASHEDIRLMRASFMLTHRVPPAFDFWRYLTESMEDDFSQIVGVNLEMWITMVVFVLVSGPLGWAALLFLCIAAALLLVVNHKLISITRHVCRGCRANHLTKDVFWFKKPALLLHPIKYILFLCSFLFGSAIWFVWSFGALSCPFTSAGNRFYFAWRAPWYISLIVAGVVFVDVSLRTLPLYSLAVQMGSEFKHHMLPRGVREKLLVIAQHIKKKHKQQQQEAAAAEGGGVRSKMRQVKQRLTS